MGRFYDGTKIPGGPYTMTQGAVAAVTMFIVINTNPIWTRGNILVDLPLGAAVVWGITWVSGKIRTGNRNPAQLLMGLIHASFAPGHGTYNDTPVRTSRPHSTHSRIITDIRPLSSRSVEPKPTTPVSKPASIPMTAPAPDTPRAITAVERLLAQTTR